MRKIPLLHFLALAASVIIFIKAEAAPTCSVKPVDLRVEYLVAPEGLDEKTPRFSWALEASNPDNDGQKQSAYQIVVKSPNRVVWDSGWVASSKMQQIEYQGSPLESDLRYTWTLNVKDENGIAALPSQSTWTTGLFAQSEWSAKWIGSDEIFDYKIGIKKGDCNIADPWLRKTFTLGGKPGHAVMFLASVGYHELYVNGKQIDASHMLSPVATDHTKRARYIAYDIASALRPGKNIVAIWLGAGWSIFAGYNMEDRPRTPIVRAQADIYIKRSDAKPLMRLETDETWKTHPSPNKLLGTWDFRNMGGEIYDATREQETAAFATAGLDDTNWKNATVYNPKLQVTAQRAEKNRRFDEIRPVAIEEREPGVWRVDMGTNFAGWTEIKVAGKPGARVDFLFSERRQDEMTFRNRSAYIIGPSGAGVFRNRFNYSSGRWITIRGLNAKPALEDIRGWNVRSDVARVTTFECSDPLQNWIYERICWTFENLSLGGMVVDCPQRERMGYGDGGHTTAEAAMFNYRVAAFYTKWLEDWRDVQGTESMVGNMNDPKHARVAPSSGRILGGGIMPHTAPTYWGGGGPGWGGSCVVVPWFLYEHEGDTRALETNFEMIKKWLAFLDTHVKDDLLRRFGGKWDFLGDWLWPKATAEGMNNDSPQTLCLNNCYRVHNLKIAAKMARILGKTKDAGKWENQARVSSRAIHEKFYNADNSSYADGSMVCLAGALIADVMPDELREKVMRRLEHEIMTVRKGHIHAGIIGGATLFKVLREADRHDLIYAMTSKPDYPGWGYMRENDATTLWEMWEKDLPGHSLLHSSYLYPGAWYIDGIAGIKRDAEHPGFQHFIIRPPFPGDTGITWAKAAFHSPAGLIRSAWEIDGGGKMLLRVTVPPNTTATIYIPGNNRQYKTVKVGAGSHLF